MSDKRVDYGRTFVRDDNDHAKEKEEKLNKEAIALTEKEAEKKAKEEEKGGQKRGRRGEKRG